LTGDGQMQRLTAIVAVARQNIKGQVNSRGKGTLKQKQMALKNHLNSIA
jgi:hypothetical protein